MKETYLSPDTDRADIEQLTRDQLVIFSDLCHQELIAYGIPVPFVPKSGPKCNIVAVVWGQIVKPIQNERAKIKKANEEARQLLLAAEKEEGTVEALRKAIVEELSQLAASETENLETVKAKLVSDLVNRISWDAETLWMSDFRLTVLSQLLAGFNSEEIRTQTHSEVLEELEEDARLSNTQVLEASFNLSTNPISNVRDTCQHRVRAWRVKLLQRLVRVWKAKDPSRVSLRFV